MDLRDLQRPSAELLHAEELIRLATHDHGKPRPGGWHLTPESVVKFILGDHDLHISPKFVGSRRFVERCIVALATQRGLMLIGEPGTAKSLLSELLAAAISGDSTLTIQGSAGTTEDDIKYSWNYALLMAEGPTTNALVPAPLYQGMAEGKIVRFEEITRCPLEIQDTILSILSDRVMTVPEFKHDGRTVFAHAGFNVIATANTRDRGVNDMSAALKRRFNFETVHPIQDLQTEVDLVKRETAALLERANIPLRLSDDLTQVLVVTFHELRDAKTMGGKALEPLSTIMSTAEAVAVAYAAGIHAHYFGATEIQPEHLVHNLVGSALKENTDDLKKVRHYFQHVVRGRTQPGWEDFFNAAQNTDELGSSRDS